MTIDREIALAVMKWEYQQETPKHWPKECHNTGAWRKSPDDEWFCDRCQWDFYPSTDIAQAFEVLSVMGKKPFPVRNQFIKALHIVIADDCNSSKIIMGMWNLFFLKPKHICLAALEAVKDDEGGRMNLSHKCACPMRDCSGSIVWDTKYDRGLAGVCSVCGVGFSLIITSVPHIEETKVVA